MQRYTLPQLQSRHSVRAFSTEPIEESLRTRLDALTEEINACAKGLRVVTVYGDNEPFRGFKRSYGMFKNARNYLACIIDQQMPDATQTAGYYAEAFVMKTVASGLGTCFVGGTFDANHVGTAINAGETLLFLVIFGYPQPQGQTLVAKLATRLAHRKQRSPRDFFLGTDEEYAKALGLFPTLPEALEAVACAPSALNKQPVRLRLTPGDQLEALDILTNTPSIELGIAKFNISCVDPTFLSRTTR